MFQQPSAVRPATGPTNFVAHPSISGFKQPSATRPATGPTNLVAHPSIRGLAVLPKRCSLKNRPKSTPAHGSVAAVMSHKHRSIIRVGAGLIQFVHTFTCSQVAETVPIKILFRPFRNTNITIYAPSSLVVRPRKHYRALQLDWYIRLDACQKAEP